MDFPCTQSPRTCVNEIENNSSSSDDDVIHVSPEPNKPSSFFRETISRKKKHSPIQPVQIPKKVPRLNLTAEEDKSSECDSIPDLSVSSFFFIIKFSV